MYEGKWALNIKSPMGKQEATIELKEDGAALTGTLTDANGTVDIKDGAIDNDQAVFKAPLKTPFGVMDFDFKLTAEGDTIKGDAKMKMGKMPVEGTRI